MLVWFVLFMIGVGVGQVLDYVSFDCCLCYADCGFVVL